MDEKQSSKTRGKPIKCRAAVVRQPGEPLVIEEIMVAPPVAREVRVRIICTSPSRTDISFWEMKDEPANFPRREFLVTKLWVGNSRNEVAEGARLCGATKIIGVDLNPDKFEVGKKFGVTEFVNAGDCGNKTVSQVIKEITGGGADYCFECVGLASLVQEAYASCRKGWGKTIVLGADKPGSTLSLSSYDVLYSGKSLKGCLFGGIKAKTDIPILIKRYLDKELQLDEFITHEVKFDDINKAFDLLIQGKSLRCVIWMDK